MCYQVTLVFLIWLHNNCSNDETTLNQSALDNILTFTDSWLDELVQPISTQSVNTTEEGTITTDTAPVTVSTSTQLSSYDYEMTQSKRPRTDDAMSYQLPTEVDLEKFLDQLHKNKL